MAAPTDGCLSPRSRTYVTELQTGERVLDRYSTSYRQLADEVSGAFADFTRLSMVTDIDLLLLWVAGINVDVFDQSIADMNTPELRDGMAAFGLSRTLGLYDDAFGTSFEDELSTRLSAMADFVDEAMDREDVDT